MIAGYADLSFSEMLQFSSHFERTKTTEFMTQKLRGGIPFSRFLICWLKKRANKIRAKFVTYLSAIGFSF